ncbi:TPA: hypothetical protein DIV55_04935 [Patescibacteria group bacterium]|uniref:Methyltransferase n=1 Tax=Candidatus Gottesmanbacteria bacterium GW2011_GWA1_43_11 TaxID=1618436 RepID=A0A0G1CIY1_9BACT|nr:MAG: Methyltransferase [Candidatus Gottesmanbacteria bacterium GW2011_GWA1_43_11]HCS79054.1 hypothetical protein [Patescibacteria group bacterium]
MNSYQCPKSKFRIPKIWLVRFLDKTYRNIFQGFTPVNACVTDTMNRIFRFANKLSILNTGDYYEFGVYKGYSLWHAQQVSLQCGNPHMRYFGFDCFSGLPKPTGIDDSGDFYEGEFFCTKEVVADNIKTHGGDLSKINLIKGYFDKTLTKGTQKKYKMKKIAIAFIDCDYYSSAKVVLEFIKDLLMVNTLIVFDDWNAFRQPGKKGEQLAFLEFTQKYPRIKLRKEFSYCWHGQVFRVTHCHEN